MPAKNQHVNIEKSHSFRQLMAYAMMNDDLGSSKEIYQWLGISTSYASKFISELRDIWGFDIVQEKRGAVYYVTRRPATTPINVSEVYRQMGRPPWHNGRPAAPPPPKKKKKKQTAAPPVLAIEQADNGPQPKQPELIKEQTEDAPNLNAYIRDQISKAEGYDQLMEEIHPQLLKLYAVASNLITIFNRHNDRLREL